MVKHYHVSKFPTGDIYCNMFGDNITYQVFNDGTQKNIEWAINHGVENNELSTSLETGVVSRDEAAHENEPRLAVPSCLVGRITVKHPNW